MIAAARPIMSRDGYLVASSDLDLGLGGQEKMQARKVLGTAMSMVLLHYSPPPPLEHKVDGGRGGWMTMVSQRPSTGTPNSPPLFRCG
jgi:hypothetical protein